MKNFELHLDNICEASEVDDHHTREGEYELVIPYNPNRRMIELNGDLKTAINAIPDKPKEWYGQAMAAANEWTIDNVNAFQEEISQKEYVERYNDPWDDEDDSSFDHTATSGINWYFVIKWE